MTIQLGSTIIKPVALSIDRLTGLIWGPPACGKTVLASTAPGQKLWLLFDPDGAASISERIDVQVADFARAEDSIVENMMPRGVYEQEFDVLLSKNPQLETVVFDSATSYSQKALTHGITSGKADGRGFKASLILPGMQGYGIRNRYTLGAIQMLLRLTAKHKRHFIILCHEDVPVKDKEGNIVSITVLLGGSLSVEVPLQISEVWHMHDPGGAGDVRDIRIRPFGVRGPMRSRMFDMTTDGLIRWRYNQAKDEGMKIADYYNQWRDGGFKKLPLPKG